MLLPLAAAIKSSRPCKGCLLRRLRREEWTLQRSTITRPSTPEPAKYSEAKCSKAYIIVLVDFRRWGLGSLVSSKQGILSLYLIKAQDLHKSNTFAALLPFHACKLLDKHHDE